MKIKILTVLLGAIAFFLFPKTLSAKIIFVNINVVAGNEDGTSWQDAYPIFQLAINEAVEGDTIWVAQGTYHPTADTSREISFEISEGIHLFGGFLGNETQLAERDFETNKTILSGDIGLENDSTDNSFTVVHFECIDAPARIDGFFIEKGNANDDSIAQALGRTKSGGGIFVAGSVPPIIENCWFENNTAVRYGGAIFFSSLNAQTFTVSDCHLKNNQALSGSGIYINGATEPSDYFFENNIFENNQSSFDGGAIYWRESSGSHLYMDSCQFISNKANHGAAIYYSELEQSGNFQIFGSDFINNISEIEGGALYILKSGEATENIISGCQFIGNQLLAGVNGYGGAISLSSLDFFTPPNFTIQDSDFKNNIAIHGGAISSYSFFAIPYQLLELTDCSFITNSAEVGGAIFNDAGNMSLFNCIFEKNNATQVSGAMHFTLNGDKIIRAVNSTFYKNIAKWGGVIGSNNVNEIFIQNSIFVKNRASLGGDLISGGMLDLSFSLLDTTDCVAAINTSNTTINCGDGMLFNIDPMFRDTAAGDLSLLSCSPAINAGDNLSIDTLGVTTDLVSNPRILDEVVDLGAFEQTRFFVNALLQNDVTCPWSADGWVSWLGQGTPPLTYTWSNGTTTGTDSAMLAGGNYIFTITDADGCQDSLTFEIGQPDDFWMDSVVVDASGATVADGSIVTTMSGGTPPYLYFWSNGDTTSMIENLLAGIYTVTVIDANGCVFEENFEVNFMTNLEVFEKINNVELRPNFLKRGEDAVLFFEIKNANHFEITLLGNGGQLLFEQKIELNEGKHFFKIPTPEIAGLYFVKIKNPTGESKVLKLVVN